MLASRCFLFRAQLQFVMQFSLTLLQHGLELRGVAVLGVTFILLGENR